MKTTRKQAQALAKFMAQKRLDDLNVESAYEQSPRGTSTKRLLTFVHNSIEHRIKSDGTIEKRDWTTA